MIPLKELKSALPHTTYLTVVLATEAVQDEARSAILKIGAVIQTKMGAVGGFTVAATASQIRQLVRHFSEERVLVSHVLEIDDGSYRSPEPDSGIVCVFTRADNARPESWRVHGVFATDQDAELGTKKEFYPVFAVCVGTGELVWLDPHHPEDLEAFSARFENWSADDLRDRFTTLAWADHEDTMRRGSLFYQLQGVHRPDISEEARNAVAQIQAERAQRSADIELVDRVIAEADEREASGAASVLPWEDTADRFLNAVRRLRKAGKL